MWINKIEDQDAGIENKVEEQKVTEEIKASEGELKSIEEAPVAIIVAIDAPALPYPTTSRVKSSVLITILRPLNCSSGNSILGLVKEFMIYYQKDSPPESTPQVDTNDGSILLFTPSMEIRAFHEYPIDTDQYWLCI